MTSTSGPLITAIARLDCDGCFDGFGLDSIDQCQTAPSLMLLDLDVLMTENWVSL